MVTCGVVGTVNTHFRTVFAIVSIWTNLIAVVSDVSRKAVTLPGNVMAAVRLPTGRAGHSALLPIHSNSAFVLTAGSPVSWTTHTSTGFSHTCVAVGTMFEAGLVTVTPPQTL